MAKYCKNCREEIVGKQKFCPKCGKKQGLPKWVIILIVVLVIGVFASTSNSDETTKTSNDSSKQEVREYTSVNIDDLEDALENNAAAAKDTYDGKYLEITGRLGTIDSDLKYISLLSVTDDWDMIGVHCTIKNSKTKEVVKSLSKDQTIIVKGKITDVGEVLGYYLDIDEVIPQ